MQKQRLKTIISHSLSTCAVFQPGLMRCHDGEIGRNCTSWFIQKRMTRTQTEHFVFTLTLSCIHTNLLMVMFKSLVLGTERQ